MWSRDSGSIPNTRHHEAFAIVLLNMCFYVVVGETLATQHETSYLFPNSCTSLVSHCLHVQHFLQHSGASVPSTKRMRSSVEDRSRSYALDNSILLERLPEVVPSEVLWPGGQVILKFPVRNFQKLGPPVQFSTGSFKITCPPGHNT